MKTVLTILMSCSILSLTAQQDKIEFAAPLVYPEGVAFNPKTNVYYVSSVTTGTIGKVDRTGKYEVFLKESTLKSSFGMKVDVKANKLWICTGDPNYSKYSDSSTYKKIAKVVAVDLLSGKKVSEIDIAQTFKGKHFANDLTFDDQGNLYVTDSYSPVIYRIDSKNNTTVFAKSDLFHAIDVGLNGIVFHPDGFLLTVNNSAGTILRVDMKDPSKITKVQIDQFFPGADGLLLDEEKNLVLVQNKGVNRVFKIASTDRWKTARVAASTSDDARYQNPTTATIANREIYILNSKMNELQDSTKNPSPTYSLQTAKFKAKL